MFICPISSRQNDNTCERLAKRDLLKGFFPWTSSCPWKSRTKYCVKWSLWGRFLMPTFFYGPIWKKVSSSNFLSSTRWLFQIIFEKYQIRIYFKVPYIQPVSVRVIMLLKRTKNNTKYIAYRVLPKDHKAIPYLWASSMGNCSDNSCNLLLCMHGDNQNRGGHTEPYSMRAFLCSFGYTENLLFNESFRKVLDPRTPIFVTYSPSSSIWYI